MREQEIKRWQWWIFCLILLFPLILSACGKKGDPIPPEEPVVVR